VHASPPAELAPENVPASVRAILATLAAAGHRAHLVGGCVRGWLRGEPVHDFDVATDARPERVLVLFPRAVPIGLRHGTVMVPTRAGPVDVTSTRPGTDLEDDLARRDFTVNAMAFDPLAPRFVDPWGGRADLAAGRLRCVGSAADRLREDPLRALRAARFAATLGLDPDAELEAALPACAAALEAVAPERVRRELETLLAGARAGHGVAILRRTGLEARLVPDAPGDAARVLDALPSDTDLRWTAWLRGTRAEAILARLRVPRRSAERVLRLLGLHPVDAHADPGSPVSVRRVLSRAGDDGVAALLALREAELAADAAPEAPARESLAALRAAFEREHARKDLALHRLDLALDGSAVMAILGCRPGPAVGRALRFLTERVLEDPALNTPDRLRELLLERRPGSDG
jgi:tRNA nucleotidyltransferase (CCA-adding enzyme)